MRKINYPFTAILGQDKMKMGLILNVIDPQIGGVLLTGHQGTGKSTAVRSLVEVMPGIEVVKNCQFSCNPKSDIDDLCEECRVKLDNGEIETEMRDMRLVNLPLGVTDDDIIPKTEEIFVHWDDTVLNLNNRLTDITKKY